MTEGLPQQTELVWVSTRRREPLSRWVPSLRDRDLRERLRRRTHLVRMLASAMNRISGCSPMGVRLSLDRLRERDAMELLEAFWREFLRGLRARLADVQADDLTPPALVHAGWPPVARTAATSGDALTPADRTRVRRKPH